jgi:gamma-D-glutamyl-L-lysine dipeptidyl-peptidase
VCYSAAVMPHLHHARRLALALVLVTAAVAARPGLGGQAPQPGDLVSKVRNQFVPDPRLGVFDVKAEAKDRAVELTGDLEQPEARAALLKAFKDAGYAPVVDHISMLPDPALADKPLAIVTVSVAVMKTKPSHSSELGNQLIMGMVVRVLKRDGGWYYVQSLDDRYLGWMETDHLAFVGKERADAFVSGRRAIVTSLFALVREAPAQNAAPVSDLVVGDVMAMAAPSSYASWFAVLLPDGRKGFVAKGDAADYASWRASRAITPERIEQTARRFMGVPYLWGGTSAKGFDCSGFVKTVFRLNGFEPQRDADQQSNDGTAVETGDDLAQLRKGDVLFFGPRPGVTRITHTGIYLGGRLFIHCSGLVKLNSFDPASPIYSDNLLKRLVKVRRYSQP